MPPSTPCGRDSLWARRSKSHQARAGQFVSTNAHSAFQCLSAGECLGDRLAHQTIDVLAGVEADWPHLRGVGLAVRQRGLLDGAVDDAPHHVAVLLVHRDKLALQRQRQFRHHWRIDELALHGGEAALRHFVRDSVSADEAQVVAGGRGVGGAEGDRERLSRGDIRPGLVRGVDADGDLVLKGDSAPGRIHHVRSPVLIVRADHQHGHREHPVLHSKVLLHRTNSPK